MTANPKPVMANDWPVWLQEVSRHLVSITKSYVGEEVQFVAIIVAPNGETKRGAIRRCLSDPPVIFEIPVTADTCFKFVEGFHDLKNLPDIAYFRQMHEELAPTAVKFLATVQVEGNA